MKNIFFVESPFQLISAIHAKNNFEGSNYLFLNKGETERKNNKSQIEALINCSDWDNIFEIKKFKNKLFSHMYIFFISFYLLFKFRFKLTTVFIGEFRSLPFNLFSRVISPLSEILLDDGNVTIPLQRYIFFNGCGFETFIKDTSKKKIIYFIIYKFIFRFKNRKKTMPDLYSMFDLDKFLYKGQINYRKKTIKIEKKTNSDIFFFGSKLAESNELTFKNEIILLKKIFLYLFKTNSTVLYIPHRDDSNKKITEIVKIGFTIKYLNMPAEIYFNETKIIPNIIAGFYTTALYSLFSCYKFEKVISFDISDYIIPNKRQGESQAPVYELYNEVGIKVLKI